MLDSRSTSQLLFGTAALAVLGFAALTSAALSGKLKRFDERAKRRVHSARVDIGGVALKRAAQSTTPFGKWWGYLPPSLATARRLQQRGSTAGAAAVAGTALLAALLPSVLKRVLPGRLSPRERSNGVSRHCYPSGHALQTSAVAVTTGYVLWREGLTPRWSLASFGIVPLATGAGRLLLDRHWTSDVLGGYCAGIALGATSAGIYELATQRV